MSGDELRAFLSSVAILGDNRLLSCPPPHLPPEEQVLMFPLHLESETRKSRE
jgi:hypothetical protein